ncbi:CRISPR-associated helicase Cas3 [Candidatus Syntrophocurvum alkaliphilum]|uniref:CRISPR-associated helicase Cas3 n=1 Tax=Candidatus Syntrophocurvum alkaliphilum TaxID=2293317 RepID=A0A6I6DHI0_9FIRM|nr:CRISPR-associated helicase/endonuclease Cas3 [Candidatus Syntrophocurvum alkaliphilum]QGT99800.1 CRISPR-associated helicase Cas3 [Candidatus Syntrophocurvum alkaliphilum]
MPMVIKFEDCLARPDINGEKQLLTTHLEVVAQAWGNQANSYEEQLYFLGGLCHDLGKARTEWQNKLTANKRPIHSVLGAIIFTFYAHELYQQWEKDLLADKNERTIAKTTILKISRDICDHHGKLEDIIAESPYEQFLSKDIIFIDIDLIGLHHFISKYYPSLNEKAPSNEILLKNKKAFSKQWAKWQALEMSNIINKKAKIENTNENYIARLLCLRDKTASFISADRFHAAQIDEVKIDKNQVKSAIEHIGKYCELSAEELIKKDKASTIIEKRLQAQKEALEIYRNNSNNDIYTLVLPTGLGKTITATRIAMESCLINEKSRIIYTAPYLSILSQASLEISQATQIDVMQHHHLAFMSEEIHEDKDIITLESWQSEIVCTSFNQLFRAFFPKRAQELIRLPALQNAFIIIDEPQIINSAVWNLFLAQLEIACKRYNCKVLFISATLPPFEYGLQNTPYKIETSVTVPARYIVSYNDLIHSEREITQKIHTEESQSICVVMNTIKDACEVFINCKDTIMAEQKNHISLNNILGNEEIDAVSTKSEIIIFNLNGLMTPIHKAFIIAFIDYSLKLLNKKIIVISTQILEAGVDLSFTKGIRPIAIYPSHVQFAGRINRHMLQEKGTLEIINYLQNGKEDSRKWVYNSVVEREETDRLIHKCKDWEEEEFLQHLNDYYKNTFKRNDNKAILNLLPKAARGEWSLLAGQQPFGENYTKHSLFIARPTKQELIVLKNFYENKPEKIMMKNSTNIEKTLNIMEIFNLNEVDEIYDFYSDREKYNQLSHNERKLFMALMQQFIVAVTPKILLSLSVSNKDLPIHLLIDKDLYSWETGLAHHLGKEDYELYF